jgi:hypothetical protein
MVMWMRQLARSLAAIAAARSTSARFLKYSRSLMANLRIAPVAWNRKDSIWVAL